MTGLALLLPLWLLRVMGAGDVKLMAAVGAVVGVPGVLYAVLWSFIFGGDVNMSSRQNVIGVPNSESFSFRVFLDTKLSAPIFGSPLLLRLQIEEGGLIAGGLFSQDETLDIPWQKTHDRIDLDALYVYKLFPWLGPYLRASGETNLLESLAYFEGPTRVDVLHADGRNEDLCRPVLAAGARRRWCWRTAPAQVISDAMRDRAPDRSSTPHRR